MCTYVWGCKHPIESINRLATHTRVRARTHTHTHAHTHTCKHTNTPTHTNVRIRPSDATITPSIGWHRLVGFLKYQDNDVKELYLYGDLFQKKPQDVGRQHPMHLLISVPSPPPTLPPGSQSHCERCHAAWCVCMCLRCVCMCVRANGECECVYVLVSVCRCVKCVRERGTERKRERESVCVCACVFVRTCVRECACA